MRRISVFTLACAVLMAVPSASAAQGLPSDPEADSPSGVVYELPVDRARKDAAPRRKTPQSQSGGGSESSGGGGGGESSGGGFGPSSTVGGTSETSIRSENNFGTSSEVPGAGSAAVAEADAERGRADRERADGHAKRARDSGGGPVDKVADLTARSTVTGADGPSDGVVYPLLAVLLAVGAGIGLFAGHRSLRGPRG